MLKIISHHIMIPPHVISWSQRRNVDNGLWDVSRRWVSRGKFTTPCQAPPSSRFRFFGFQADSDFFGFTLLYYCLFCFLLCLRCPRHSFIQPGIRFLPFKLCVKPSGPVQGRECGGPWQGTTRKSPCFLVSQKTSHWLWRWPQRWQWFVGNDDGLSMMTMICW